MTAKKSDILIDPKNIVTDKVIAKVQKEANMVEKEARTNEAPLGVEEYIKSKLMSKEGDEEDLAEIRQITLRMAKMWDEKGHIYEAIDLYKKVLKEHRGTPEAKEAKKALTKYAEKFESEEHHHQAHALYNDIFL